MVKTVFNGVFEGGGVKGIALIGALKRLEEEGVQLGRVAGTSAGAIIASLVAAGYTADELKEILEKKNFNDFADVANLFKKKWYQVLVQFFPLFFARFGYGIFNTGNFCDWIKKLLSDKGISDFKSVKDKYLRVFAVDIVNQRLLQFDRDICPDMEVAEAVRRSMSIPFFFQAQQEDHAFIVDGGVLANYPIDTFNDQGGLATTIGLKLISEEQKLPPKVPANIFAYLLRIIETMQLAHERVHIEEAKWAKTIPIPTGTISTIKFDLTETEKQFLWKSGYEAADKAIKKDVLSATGRKTD